MITKLLTSRLAIGIGGILILGCIAVLLFTIAEKIVGGQNELNRRTSSPSKNEPLPREPFNVFYSVGEEVEKKGEVSSEQSLNQKQALELEEVAPKSLEEVSKRVFTVPPLREEARQEILPLPQISDAELTTAEDGVSTIDAYLEYFATHGNEVKISQAQYETALKNEYGVLLLPQELVERLLRNNNFDEVRSSFEFFRDFIANKILFLRSIKTRGEATEVNRTVIAIEKLTLELIEKAVAAGVGKIDKSELQEFYRKYQNTTAYYNFNFRMKAGLGIRKKGTLLNDILGFFGIKQRHYAEAATILPFGGMINTIIPCTCSFGTSIIVGPPRPANLYMSYLFMSSPLFYAYKSIKIGAWILGNYATGGTCLEYIGTTCVPINSPQGTVIMAGTSL